MLGWQITVKDESMESLIFDYESSILAKWEIKPSRMQWLYDLPQTRKATNLTDYGDSYYWRYNVLARDVLPLIENGPPESADHIVLPEPPDRPIDEKWISKIVFYKDRIASCPEDHKLWIDVIDCFEDETEDIIYEMSKEYPDISDEEFEEHVFNRQVSTKIMILLSFDDDPKTGRLASWRVGVYGLDWLNNLVKDGKATVKETGGYPNTYTALACDVLPLIANGPPSLPSVQGPVLIDSVGHGWNWFDDVIIHSDRIAECPQDRVITIVAFDLS